MLTKNGMVRFFASSKMSWGFILTLGENQLFRGVFLGNQVKFVTSVTVVAWGFFPKYLRPYKLNMSLEYVGLVVGCGSLCFWSLS